ncbi:acyl-CoA thioesterase [Marinomonas sp. A79]|uniref:Acyl-CoA thioesterase n=1 Tax=Marinomonas vulgaris TaxID=2823372 RepID=A0ABS5H9W5_9GAMM|nr:acyl-CoA thioesterase [Marinomonas vulgaris]MBR7888458.1 acyl-CoA thioesterase [Marinomonas vulgaris]
MKQLHHTQFIVRDYECDMQGIVNNSVYQNYLEHARHQFLHSRGLDFAATTFQGINLVVIRAELDYKRSLRSNDEFYVETRVERESKLKFAFYQHIYRSNDKQLMLKAKVTITSTTPEGRPIVFKEAERLLDRTSDNI